MTACAVSAPACVETVLGTGGVVLDEVTPVEGLVAVHLSDHMDWIAEVVAPEEYQQSLASTR